MKITTLRTSADDCPHTDICPSVHDLDTDPRSRYVISKESTAAERAVFAGELRDDELLGWMPAEFLPESNPILARTAAVTHPDLRPDRQYVITTAVTDPAVLAAFAHLIGHDEQLGYVPAPQLALV